MARLTGVCNLFADSKTLITLLGNGELDTLSLGEGDPRLVALTNDENVGEASSEGLVTAVLQVDDVETTGMAFTVSDNTNATHAVTTGDDGDVSSLELGESVDLAGLQVQANSVVDLDEGIGEADGATVVGNNEGDGLGTNLHLLDLAELVLGLLLADAVDDKATLGVVEDTEVLTSSLELNNVHNTGGVVGVSADLVVNLDVALHNNAGDLALGKGVLQAVADEDNEGKALTQLVGSSRGTRGKSARQLVQHPGLGRGQTLQMLAGSTSLQYR